ncbi:MAG: hypothetical protein L6R40_008367 [Gallowayella cf. fulva]|nr:MAG: hypothetical protein L6R40_008367 [Xanthomendoza cf. fulva]
MSIRPLLLSCLAAFTELVKQYGSHESEVAAAAWVDELGRLRIWAANVGAHQSGLSSLDFRLRDASHISNEVVKLLSSLKRLLDEALEAVSDDTHDNLPADDALDEDPITELQAIFEELQTIIQCLYKLAMIVRNPTQHDFLKESHRSETAAFEPFYRQHVRDKFPQAEEELIHRLAKAMTRRRGYFKYRERHSIKLAKGLVDEDQDAQTRFQQPAGTISETMASSVQLQSNVIEDPPASDCGVSQTSYAPSILEGGTITVPAPPKESISGQPFVCPHCHFIVNITTTKNWHRHVFVDLRPYSCLFQPCKTPDKLYSSRREWFAHVCGAHDTGDLSCPLCKISVGTTKLFERHVGRHLEELALFILPRDAGSDEDEGYDEDFEPHDSNDGERASQSETNSVGTNKISAQHFRHRSEEPALSVLEAPEPPSPSDEERGSQSKTNITFDERLDTMVLASLNSSDEERASQGERNSDVDERLTAREYIAEKKREIDDAEYIRKMRAPAVEPLVSGSPIIGHDTLYSGGPVAGSMSLPPMKDLTQEKVLFWEKNASLTEKKLQKRWRVQSGELLGLWVTDQTDITHDPKSSSPNHSSGSGQRKESPDHTQTVTSTAPSASIGEADEQSTQVERLFLEQKARPMAQKAAAVGAMKARSMSDEERLALIRNIQEEAEKAAMDAAAIDVNTGQRARVEKMFLDRQVRELAEEVAALKSASFNELDEEAGNAAKEASTTEKMVERATGEAGEASVTINVAELERQDTRRQIAFGGTDGLAREHIEMLESAPSELRPIMEP